MNQAFDSYLKKGAPAYAPRFAFTVTESIQLIHRAGGIAVLAHPGHMFRNQPGFSQILDTLSRNGLDGVEVYYPTHSSSFRKKLKEMAKRRELLFTGGSDYHGEIRHGSSLAGGKNVFVPRQLLDIMKKRRERYV